jgi:hypothetical protein
MPALAQLIIQAIKDLIDFIANYFDEMKQECKAYAQAAEAHLENMLRNQSFREPDDDLFDWREPLKETI